MAIALADFFYSRLQPLMESRGWGWWSFLFLSPGNAGHGFDIGGIYEALMNVYGISGQPHHLTLASYFSNPWFFDPLLKGTDSLHNEHANAHIPISVGVARGAELTGNETLGRVARLFWARLNGSYTFSTGGSSVDEYWKFPGQHGDAIATSFNQSTGAPVPLDSNGFHTQEMCALPLRTASAPALSIQRRRRAAFDGCCGAAPQVHELQHAQAPAAPAAVGRVRSHRR